MKPKTIEKLLYFEGKVCTIFLPTINRQFDEDTARKHFIVRVREIDTDGIWGTNLITDTVCFFAMDQISSIQEELELDLANPEHAKLIEQYKASQVNPPEPTGDTTFVDIDALTKLARQTKQAYESIK